MIGKNEGGWSTIVISALDNRIKNSYAIASSFPLWMSPNQENFGGYEHHLPQFYQIANYLELYSMSAFGNDRSLVLFYNEFDPFEPTSQGVTHVQFLAGEQNNRTHRPF